MPSTYTVNLGIEKPATGEQSGTWGDTTNVNFDIIDQAVNGSERVTLTSAGTSGSPNDLNIVNGSTTSSEGRNKWIEIYSASDLGGSAYVRLVPNDAEKILFIRNSLAGSQSVLLFQGTYNASNDLEIPAGVDMVVKFDGAGASATVTDVFTKLRATEITTPTFSTDDLTAGTADINNGTVEAVIGGTTPKAGTFTNLTANTDLSLATGATVTGINTTTNMSDASATTLATSLSIKTYVDDQVATADTLAEVLANGNTSGANNLIIDNGQALTTNTINETTAGSGVTIDSVLLKDDVVNATDIETSNISANDGTAAATIANSTGLFTVTSFASGSVNIDGGAIDGTNIGSSSAALGTFTTVSTDTVSERTTDAGVTVDGLLIKDGDLDVAAGFSISGAGGMNFTIDDDDTSTNTYFAFTQGSTQVDIFRIKENGDIAFFEETGTNAEMNWSAADSQLRFDDGIAAAFGDSQDLLIHHTSSQNYIEDAGSGNLNLKSNGNNINFLDGSDNLVFQVDLDQETALFYNTTRVLETDAKGLVRISPTTTTTTTIGELDSRILLLNNTTTNNAGGEIVFGYTDTNVDRYAAISATADSNGASGGTGSLRFSTKAQDADTALVSRMIITDDGNVVFYEDGGANAKMTWEAANEQLKFEDSVKASFGTSSDLQIYHDGSNSYVQDNGTGALILEGTTSTQVKGSTFVILRSTAGENMAVGNANGSFDLYYDAALKLSTTTDGVDITGTATVDGVRVDGNIVLYNEGDELQFNTSSTPVNKIYTDDTYTTNGLTIDAENGVTLVSANNYLLLDDTATNEMVLNVDGGERMRVTSAGVDVTGDLSTDDLDVSGTTTLAGVTVSGAVLTDQALIAALDGTISETAVAIYVYDTTQDSDGGNWRKNTRHTSWYNEELNTSVRGARREFPSLAIIVAETGTVTIFDGDDPTLPMWMVFNCGGGRMFYSGGVCSQGVVAGNGIVWCGTGGTGALGQANFIGDEGFLRVTGSNQYNRQNIIRRNDSLSDTVTGVVPGLANRTLQGLAIYIDHNAMVDPSTGLPAPYVAAATAASMEVLVPDLGRVTSITHNSWGFEHPHFTDKGELLWNRDTSTYYQYRADKWEYGFQDYVANSGGQYIGVASGNPENGTDAYRQLVGRMNDMAATDYGYAVASNSVIDTRGGLKGLGLYMRNRAYEGRGMVARLTSEYNTGFMPNYCWGAMLADTDDTDVTGSELLTNPDFTSDVTSWSGDGTSTVTWNASGYADIDRNGSASNAGRTTMTQNVSGLTVGACYTVTMRVVTQTVRAGLYVYNSTGTSEIDEYLTDNDDSGADGNDIVYTISFIATATEHRIGVGLRGSSSATGSIDYVRMRAAEESRAVATVAPVVFGTVPKQVVNSNCDLVSYGPFSSTNYLVRYPAANISSSSIEQENALDWGTGNFTIMLWFNNTSYTNRQILLRKTDSGDGAGRWALTIETNGNLNFGIEGSSGSNLLTASSTQYTRNAAIWNQVIITREDNQLRMFVNGHLVADARNGTDFSATPFQQLAIGSLGFGAGDADSTEMALLRIARKPISQEQVKQCYYAELAMFQPTESGGSRKVTIPADAPGEIAFDPVSKILYGNTNSGDRYALSGLVRYDTTSETASTTIHAYDDLVLDD